MERERQDEKARFRARNLYKFRAIDLLDFKRKFIRAYLYYIALIKGERRDEQGNRSREDELSSAFNALLVDIEDPKE
jgi:3'-phosphoadenosine 5'-phosphosulfate sulfotransferase (PAPS reductase)/FAD synthetase